MQRRAAGLATGLILLSSAPAWAQNQQGILAGLNLLWEKPTGGNTEALFLTAGNAWIQSDVVEMQAAGHLYQATGMSPVPLDNIVAHPTLWAPRTIYYCYVTLGGVDPDFTSTSGHPYALVCSSYTGPNCDGTPSGLIQSPTSAAPTTNAAFVGSFQTDTNTNIVPYYRNGDEVVLAYPADVPAGTVDTGLWFAGNTYGAAPSNWETPPVTPCPILSAVSCIFDVHYNNPAGSVSTTYVLDPHNGNAAPGFNQIQAAGPHTWTFAAQAQLYTSVESFPAVQTNTIRLRLNADNVGTSHAIWTGNDDNTGPTVTFVLRGYVEPIDALCSR